jgi:hypothetical protein
MTQMTFRYENPIFHAMFMAMSWDFAQLLHQIEPSPGCDGNGHI